MICVQWSVASRFIWLLRILDWLVCLGILGTSHEGTLDCVVPIYLIECAWLVCAQWGIASWCILSWGVLGWSVFHGTIGMVWLLTISLRLVISLVARSTIPSLPLLIVGGRLVGMVLLCEHLFQ